jgi:hypothetical protein
VRAACVERRRAIANLTDLSTGSSCKLAKDRGAASRLETMSLWRRHWAGCARRPAELSRRLRQRCWARPDTARGAVARHRSKAAGPGPWRGYAHAMFGAPWSGFPARNAGFPAGVELRPESPRHIFAIVTHCRARAGKKAGVAGRRPLGCRRSCWPTTAPLVRPPGRCSTLRTGPEAGGPLHSRGPQTSRAGKLAWVTCADTTWLDTGRTGPSALAAINE